MTSNQSNYNDRKMAKWQGFVLSDHAELLQKSDNIKKKQSLNIGMNLLFIEADDTPKNNFVYEN